MIISLFVVSDVYSYCDMKEDVTKQKVFKQKRHLSKSSASKMEHSTSLQNHLDHPSTM